MDNMTIIAVASIVIAGLHHQFRMLGACTGGREGGRDGTHFAGPATRCLRYNYPDPVCRSGDDRVHGYLLLRTLDDSHFRQPVLEPRHRPNCGEVTHAH